jgi:hypothetical protein
MIETGKCYCRDAADNRRDRPKDTAVSCNSIAERSEWPRPTERR